MLQWIQQNQALAAMIFSAVWIVVPTVASLATKKLDSTTAGHAFLSMLAAAGFDGSKFLVAAKAFAMRALGIAGSALASLATLTLIAVVGLALQLAGGATIEGCAWFSKSQPVVVQYGEKDVACVFAAITGGAASVASVGAACAGLTAEQIASIAVSLFDYYALGETDSGLAGAALPPAKGLPAKLSAAEFAKLSAFVGR